MTVDNQRVIDLIHIDTETDEVVLTIADHLPWDEAHEHLLILQEKLNTYLAFLESGEINESYPAAMGRQVRIALVHREALDACATGFLNRAKAVIEDAGFTLTWRHQPG